MWEERGRTVQGTPFVTPPARFVSIIDAADLARAMDEACHMARTEMAGRSSSILEEMRSSSQKYAKERTWQAAKDSICGALKVISGPPVIQAEDL